MTAVQIAMFALGLSFLVQFGGIVWFASAIRASVMQLTQSTQELRAIVQALNTNNSLLDRRLAVVEDRQQRARAGDLD